MLGEFAFQWKQSLAGIAEGSSAQVFIVDTRVKDISSWPAPLLLMPEGRRKSWVFLCQQLADLGRILTLPEDGVFCELDREGLERAASFVQRRLGPDASRRIEKAAYSSAARAIVVRMENGRAYVLKLDDLSETDGSDVTSVKVGSLRSYLRIIQESGKVVDVPWDVVLYHCDPEYPYYKGRGLTDSVRDRSGRIGGRVRSLRVQQSLSINELAQRAGMLRPNVSRLEAGTHLPSLETLERIAAALGVPVAELVAAR